MGTAARLRGLRTRINQGKVRFGEAAETSTRAACAPRKVRYIASVFVNAFRDRILADPVLLSARARRHLPHRVSDRS